MLVTSSYSPSPGCKIQKIGKSAEKLFRFLAEMRFAEAESLENLRDSKDWTICNKTFKIFVHDEVRREKTTFLIATSMN